MENEKQEKLKKVLKKAVDIKKNSDLAIAREFVDLDEKIEENFEELGEKIEIISEELKKKSEYEFDYQINKEELKGDKGEDGKDYILTEKDKKEIAKSITVPVVEKIVEKREIVKEQPIIYKNVTNEIKEVAKYEDRKQIVDKINAGGKEKINASQITGLPEFTREVVREVGTVGHIETPLKAGTNITITSDATGAKVISSTSGSTESDWTKLATRWTSAPTLYDTQATYSVYEYTYASTNYYRKVLNTYDPAQDNFYQDNTLSVLIASRAL